MRRNDIQTIAKSLTPIFIVIMSMALTSILIIIAGKNPLEAYYYMLTGAVSDASGFINTINKAIPICFAGFAMAVSYKSGLFNIGLEGQLMFGALGSAVAGAYITDLPVYLHIPICFICGMLFGMAYAALPAVMYVTRGTNLLVVHLLMNSIATLLITFFVTGPFACDNEWIAATPRIMSTAELPYIITEPNNLSMGIIIVLAVGILLWWYMNKTISGFELNVCGDNLQAAKYAGISIKKYQVGVLLVSGALAGLAGSVEVLGNFHRLYDGFSPGYGFDGIPIAMLANCNPFGIMIGSFVFGALRVGAINMQSEAGVSTQIISVIQGSLITLIAAQYIIRFEITKVLYKFIKRDKI